ncbi:MAG: hypothetical protein ACD_47C00031G0004 [uncultured bacterium]|uniref:Prepilin-type N-terminal cleavage/methylation domain-containing protein n=1 Tax=Candidatus Wallbacteria bacterium GWC2_49_35 TaxID=1817813 RepID=A0A1F7WF01_9BACT|nr:MAG: hypothetical protein ACD_47C00031G0004 [uncultured bacterium]OGM01401.1 MAG: hypothetical protein A2008_02595 [Candidatus Wallbacteria bacterium GWC2_49_35]HBC73394.1 hypothetical protein [Candidatus Wallbacteria bacterium]
MVNNIYGAGIKCGFTFIEIMIALVVLSLGMFPLLSLFSSTTSDISYTIDNVLVTTYANELIDSILAHNFDDIPETIALSELGALSGNQFFTRLAGRLSTVKPGYERFIEISTMSINLGSAAGLCQSELDKLEKYKKIKKLIVKIKFMHNGADKCFTVGTLISGAE